MIVDTADTVNCPVCASPEIQQTWSYDGGYPTSQGRSVMACPECDWSHPGDSIEQINPLLVELRRRATLAKLGHPEWDNLDRERELRENRWDGDGEPSDVELWRWLYEIIDEPNRTPAEGWGPDVVAHLVPARGKDQLVFRLTANLPPEPGATTPHHYAIGAPPPVETRELLAVVVRNWSCRKLHRDARHALAIHVRWLIRSAESDAMLRVTNRWRRSCVPPPL